MLSLRSLFLFVVAGLCEIGGGYLGLAMVAQPSFLVLRQSRGAALLLAYGIDPTYSTPEFRTRGTLPTAESSSLSQSCGAGRSTTCAPISSIWSAAPSAWPA